MHGEYKKKTFGQTSRTFCTRTFHERKSLRSCLCLSARMCAVSGYDLIAPAPALVPALTLALPDTSQSDMHATDTTKHILQPTDVCHRIACMCLLQTHTGRIICRVGSRAAFAQYVNKFHVVVPISKTLALFSLGCWKTNLKLV